MTSSDVYSAVDIVKWLVVEDRNNLEDWKNIAVEQIMTKPPELIPGSSMYSKFYFYFSGFIFKVFTI